MYIIISMWKQYLEWLLYGGRPDPLGVGGREVALVARGVLGVVVGGAAAAVQVGGVGRGHVGARAGRREVRGGNLEGGGDACKQTKETGLLTNSGEAPGHP